MVVQQKMVMLAEKDSVGDVGSAAISGPVLNVMSLGPGGRSLAAGPAASTVAFR